jgi:hypothetical protein
MQGHAVEVGDQVGLAKRSSEIAGLHRRRLDCDDCESPERENGAKQRTW